MKATGLIPTAMLLGLCFGGLAGCKKHPPLATLPPATAKAAPVRHEEKLPEPPAPQPTLPAAQPASTITSQPVATIPPPPEPPKTTKRRMLRKTPKTPPVLAAQADPPVGPPAAAETPDAAPRLGQLLSPDQEQSYNEAINRELQRARTNVTFAQTKSLSDAQKSVVTQVQNFIKQAEDTRKADLVEAKGLSHKADILASSLARSLQ